MSVKTDNYTFAQTVLDITRMVPVGRVTTYGAIASAAGSAQSSRMVGYVLNGCAGNEESVPAHRVVNRNGMLTGKQHFGHPGRMQELLEKEGIKIKDDTVVDFEKLFWNPLEELSM